MHNNVKTSDGSNKLSFQRILAEKRTLLFMDCLELKNLS